MSIALVRKDEPEHGGGDDGGDEVPCYCCEWCGETEFMLATWREMNVGICTACHMPQVSLIWGLHVDE